MLLGRRKLNCLSCGVDVVKETVVQGKDGVMYRNKLQEDIESISTNVVVTKAMRLRSAKP